MSCSAADFLHQKFKIQKLHHIHQSSLSIVSMMTINIDHMGSKVHFPYSAAIVRLPTSASSFASWLTIG
jgi:hypothetical protein